uniref:Uncharacterized protein n=1 Tax=Rhizophora mucronata TaxID=61149 RepID=A0A2P2NV65_RHIMU
MTSSRSKRIPVHFSSGWKLIPSLMETLLQPGPRRPPQPPHPTRQRHRS